LGFDEGGAIVGCGLVAGVRVLLEPDEEAGDKDEDQEDEGKDGVDDEEYNSCDADEQAGAVEDAGEDQEEDRVQEVDHGDRDVDHVGGFIHPRVEDCGGDESERFDDDESNGLYSAALLAESDKHGLDQNIGEGWNDVPVCRCSILDVEETPFVQCDGIGIQHVSRGAMLLFRASGDHNNLDTG